MATRKTAGKRKMARKSAKSSSRKASASKRGGRKMAAKRGSARKSAPRKKTARRSPVARVKRVTREVVEQAQTAMAAGVETLKDFGENLMDRVRTT